MSAARALLVIFTGFYSTGSLGGVAEPQQFEAEIKHGVGLQVCKAYAQAVDHAVFLEPPACGRWSALRSQGFDRIDTQALSPSEFEKLFENVYLYVSPDLAQPRNRENLNSERARRIAEFSNWRDLQASAESPLGRYVLIKPKPAHWMGVNVGGSDRLLMWEDNSLTCGSEHSTSGGSNWIESLQAHLLIISRDGQVNSEKSNRLLIATPCCSEPMSSKDRCVAPPLRDLVAPGLFSFKGSIFIDAYRSSDSSRLRKGFGLPSVNGSLLVYNFKSPSDPLVFECEIEISRRAIR